MALTNKLTAIGNAIREKTGKTELLTLDAMPVEILSIETGGGSGDLPDEALVIENDARYMFAYGAWNWFLNTYKNRITTKDLTKTDYMFHLAYKEQDPVELNIEFNFKPNTTLSCAHMFNEGNFKKIPSLDFKQNNGVATADLSSLFIHNGYLTEIGDIKNARPKALTGMFNNCYRLRQLPNFINFQTDYINNNTAGINGMFNYCYSLRQIPEDFLKCLYSVKQTSVYSNIYYNTFQNCYALDEIRGLTTKTANLTSNAFNNTFTGCSRVKDIIFETQEDGTPFTVNWKSQQIALNGNIGYIASIGYITVYNGGIQREKEVFDADSYEALKNDPDWFSLKPEYSRYNHDSAVNTINSLPDTSTFGTNNIKFKGNSGEHTDGGAINTLTEEEIAVAAAKGWTVSFV